MSAGEVVLGLLVEQPGTCYQLDKLLAERLGSAQFARGTAASAVRRLLQRELVRPADDQDDTGLHAVGGRKKTVYEATPAGVEHFKRWLRTSTQTPSVREELNAKIAFCGPRDLPRMIEIVREGELACAQRLQELNREMRLEAQAPVTDRWTRLMRLLARSGEVAWWDARIKWLQGMRLFLEKEAPRWRGAPGSGPPRPPAR